MLPASAAAPLSSRQKSAKWCASAGAGRVDRQVGATHPHLRLEARRVHLDDLEAVRIDHEVDRRRARVVGQALQQEVLDPDTGMVELRLVAGDHDQLRVPMALTHRDAQSPREGRRALERVRACLRAKLMDGTTAHLEVPGRGRTSVLAREPRPLAERRDGQQLAVARGRGGLGPRHVRGDPRSSGRRPARERRTAPPLRHRSAHPTTPPGSRPT
jgi:hypothetical protein